MLGAAAPDLAAMASLLGAGGGGDGGGAGLGALGAADVSAVAGNIAALATDFVAASGIDLASLGLPSGLSSGEELLARNMLRVQQAGVELDAMAMQALASLPPEHAAEMLEYIADNATNLRNPSKYISSTVARGFVPRRCGGLAASAAAAGVTSFGPAHPSAPASAAPPGTLISPEELQALLGRATERGITLADYAVTALAGLAAEHAVELLEFVLERHYELRDPSNYIASTVARGFKSRKFPGSQSGGAQTPQLSHSNGAQADPALNYGGSAVQPFDAGFSQAGAGSTPEQNPQTQQPSVGSATEALARSLLRMQEAGVELDEMAKQALATLPPEHASEMIEYVADNARSLRNPSKYISSTVARGFVPRGTAGGKGGPPLAGAAAVADSSRPPPPNIHVSLIPADATALEKRILGLNLQTLSGSQQIDFLTYLALRCVPLWKAAELLDSLEAKSGTISSPCNYIQAAVTKIQKEGQAGGGLGLGASGYGSVASLAAGAYDQQSLAIATTAYGAAESSLKRPRVW